MIDNDMAKKILNSLLINDWSIIQVYEGTDRDFIIMREGADAGEKGKGYFIEKGMPELYMGLYTKLPNLQGENGVEVVNENQNNYQRISISGYDIYNNGYIFTGAEIADGTGSDPDPTGTAFMENKQDILFPVASGNGWAPYPKDGIDSPDVNNPDHWEHSPLVGFGIYTAKTGGTLVLWGKLLDEYGNAPTSGAARDTIVKIPKGSFKVTFS